MLHGWVGSEAYQVGHARLDGQNITGPKADLGLVEARSARSGRADDQDRLRAAVRSGSPVSFGFRKVPAVSD